MVQFLRIYRGAAVYDITKKEKVMRPKILAKAIIPNQEDARVAFIKEADTQEDAVKKVEKEIDEYLEEHRIDKFLNEIF